MAVGQRGSDGPASGHCAGSRGAGRRARLAGLARRAREDAGWPRLRSTMKIKRLEMVGFKSFVDRTVVNFDHDVMAIVGPNGCGKSNIVDAIRWCMGEQSRQAPARPGDGRRHLQRLGAPRSGHDFAEVTLTFENDDPGDVPIEYRDYAGDCRHAAAAPRRRQRVPDQQDPGPPEGRHRPLPRHRRRHQGVLHRRAGQDRPHRQREAGGPAPAHRGGRRHHEVQGAEEAGRAEDGADAAEPAARRRHRRRDRAEPRLAQAPGRQGRALRCLPHGARGSAALRGRRTATSRRSAGSSTSRRSSPSTPSGRAGRASSS